MQGVHDTALTGRDGEDSGGCGFRNICNPEYPCFDKISYYAEEKHCGKSLGSKDYLYGGTIASYYGNK